MIQEYYAFLYSKIHIKWISRLLSRALYLLRILKYKFESAKIESKTININSAREIVNSCYPKPNYEIKIQNKPVDDSIDISVIIPVYNYKDIIPSCIDSVINQKTKYNFEVILVDDGSTDGSSEVVDTYSKYDNVVIIHKQNGGIGAARNTGLDNARGKYIMFVDCDDYVHDDYIENMLNKAYETNDDIVICGYTLIKKQNGIVVSKRDILYSEKNLCGYSKDEAIMNYQGLPWNKIYKRELWKNVRYIPGYWYEDTITHFLIFRLAKSYSFVNKSFYDYMWYENNFSHTQTKVTLKSIQRFWFLEVMSEESERVELPLDEGFYKVLIRHSGMLLRSGIYSLDEEIKNAVFSLACEMIKKYRPKTKYKLTFIESELEKALLSNDISKWELVCKYR